MAKAKKRTAKRKKKVILPMKMSALIKIALTDIRKVERDTKKFVLDMGIYFNPNVDVTCSTSTGDVLDAYKVCSLCAAGAVMAFSLGKANSLEELTPDSFPGNVKQLQAIDSLRQGEAGNAWLKLVGYYDDGGREAAAANLDTNIPEYDRDNPEPFHRAMGMFQKKLIKAGF